MSDFDQFVEDFIKHLIQVTGIPKELLLERPKIDHQNTQSWRDIQVYRKLLLPSKKMPMIDPGKDE